MIKRIKYKKLLKTLFAILLIVFLGLSKNCIVKGYFDETIKINLPGHFFYGSGDANYITNDLNFDNNGKKYLIIQDHGRKNNDYYIFWNNGKLYTYGYYGYFNDRAQGYFVKFCKTNGTGLCDGGSIDIGNEFYNLSGVNFSQFIGSRQNETDDPGLCFYNVNNNTNYCTQVYAGNESFLTGSLNLIDGLNDFSNRAQNSIYTENNNNNNNITNIGIGSCPTIRQVMQNMGENYNTGLCYNNTIYFNGTNFEQIDQENIFTIFNDDYQNYVNRISIYRNNCTNANTIQACQNAFSGEYKKYSIISNAMNSNVDEKKLRNYCNLGLNYDPNTTTCVASGGGIKEPYTTEEMIKDIIDNGIIVTPKTTGENQNNVINALNKCENGDRECYINDRNFIESMKNIYEKITGLFKERNGVNGIIPNYILRITFMTILFTVIFKK